MQEPRRVDVRWEWINQGWEMYQREMGNWLGISAIGFLLSFIPVIPTIPLMISLLGRGNNPRDIMAALQANALTFAVQIVAGVLSWLVQAFTYSGYYNVAMKQLRGERIAIGDFFGGLQYFVPSLGVAAIIGGIALVGNFICCLGYLFLLLTCGIFLFTYPLIVERKLGTIDALKESSNIAMNNVVMFTLFAIVVYLIGFGGAILCGVGIIFTMPILICSVTCAYRDCTGMTNATYGSYEPPPPPSYGGYDPPPPPSSWQ